MAGLLILSAVMAAAIIPPAPAIERPRLYVIQPDPAFPEPHPAFWVPKPAEVERATSVLLAYLALAGPIVPVGNAWSEKWRPAIAREIGDYSLQFTGVRRATGNQAYKTGDTGPKSILILGLCRVDPGEGANLTRVLLFVEDGGHCYFTAVYDPEEDRLTYFDVNGIG
jgi:hypothetical protein